MSTDQVLTANKIGPLTVLHQGETRQFHQWMFDTIRPYLKGSTLEIGSGTGPISSLFFQQGMPLYLSDPHRHHCRILQQQFQGEALLRQIMRIDLRHPDFETKYSDLLGKFSTLVALNIMDHAPNDQRAISNAKLLLRDRGHLIMALPAHTALYNGLDETLDHWKIENQKGLQRLLSRDFKFMGNHYFNLVSIVGWWLSGSNSRKDRAVSIFRVEDTNLFKLMGLSVIVAGRKIKLQK